MKKYYISFVLCFLTLSIFSQGYEFGIVHISGYNFKVVAIADFNSGGDTDVSDVGFTLMMPAGSADITNQTGLLGGRAWDLSQFDATTLMGLGGDGTEDGFLFNLPAGQTMFSHTMSQQIDLVSFDVTNMPVTGQVRFLLNSETVAMNAGGALDSFYNSNIDMTSTQDYFSGLASGLENFDFTTLGIEDLGLIGLEVYPSPTKGLLYIKGNVSDIISAEVYSMTGQRVLIIRDNFNTINLETLEASIYFLKLITERASGTFKIIKE